MDHPTPAELQELLAGGLNDQKALTVLDHLEACERCEAIICELESKSDESGLQFAKHSTSNDVVTRALEKAILRVMYRNTGSLDGIADHKNRGEEAAKTDFAFDTIGLDHSLETDTNQQSRFGEYEILREVARGGMGIVYQAKHVKLNRIVALKTILKGALAKNADVQRFYAEAEAAANLDHPNIVPVYEVGEQDGRHYFSMAFVNGQSLAERIAAGVLPPREAAAVVKVISEAIAFAHSRGTIHRDLKPANVLLAMSDHDTDERFETSVKSEKRQSSGSSSQSTESLPYTPKVSDFGLAKRFDDDQGMTATGQILGTPAYMPPEQAAGKTADVSETADVYSLGAILYCALIGRPPFQAANAIDTLRQVIDQDPNSPRNINPAIPIDLETICLKCLRKSPSERYTRADDLAEDLKCFLAGMPIQARPIGALERSIKWCRRYPAIAGLITLVTVVLLGATIVSTIFGTQASKQALRAERKAKEALVAELRERAAKTDAQQKSKAAREAAAKAREAETSAKAAEAKERESANTAKLEQSRAEKIAAELKTALNRVEEELGKSRFLAYSAQIGMVQADIQKGDVRDARDTLYRTPPGMRGWEASHLQRNMQRLITDAAPHDGAVLAIACSPGGEHFATAGADKTICIWSIKLKQTRSGLQGKKLVLPTWDAKSFKKTHTLTGHTGAVNCLAFGADGKTLYSGSKDKSIRVWDVAEGEILRKIAGHDGSVTCLALSRDGNDIFSGSEDQIVKRWDLNSGEKKAAYVAHKGPIRALAVSTNEDQFVSASDDGTLKIWNATNGEELHTLKGHQGPVARVIIPAGGQSIFSLGTDKTLRIWHLSLGAEIGSVPLAEGSALLLSANSSDIIATAEGRAVRIWNPTTSADSIRVGESQLPLQSAAIHAEGGLLLAGYENGMIALWDTRPVPGVRDITMRKGQTVVNVCFSPDGKYLAATNIYDFAADIIDVETGRTVVQLNTSKYGAIHALAFSPNGKHLATGGDVDRGIVIWDWRSGKKIREFKGQNRFINSLTFSPDGKHLISSGANDVTALVRDVQTGDITHLLGNHAYRVVASAFSPDAAYIATAADGGVVKIWDGLSDKPLHSFQAHPRETRSVVFSADSTQLLTCGHDQDIKQWDVNTGKLTRIFRGHTGNLAGIGLGPDGKQLFSVGGDRTARVWDFTTGQQAAVLPALDECTSFVVSPDGRHLAMGTYDCNLRMWETRRDEAAQTLRPSAGKVWAATWSPDGKQIAIGGDDTHVHILDAESGVATGKLSGHTMGLSALAYHPDGKRLMSQAQASDPIIWDLTNEKPLRVLSDRSQSYAEGWYADGKRYMSWDGKNINLWSAASGAKVATLPNVYDAWKIESNLLGGLVSPDRKWIIFWKDVPKPEVHVLDARSGRVHATVPGGCSFHRGVAISPNSKLLAVVDGAKLRLWDIERIKEPVQLGGFGANWGVSFSHNGKWVACGGFDSTLRVFEVATGKQAHVFRGHTATVFDVDFRPDDRQILSCSEDQTVKIWNWPPEGSAATP